MRIILHRRPCAAVFDVPAKFLKTKCAVRTEEYVDTSVVLAVLNAVDDNP